MQLYTQISGKGDPVVLLHGLFGSYENLGVIARALSEQYLVINVDVRNHGRSAHAADMDYVSMAEDLAATLQHLGYPEVSLLGHSMGGKIAMTFAMHYPERVHKLIVADIAPVGYQARHHKILDGLTSLNLATLPNRTAADQHLATYVSEPGVRQFLLKSLVKEEQGFRWRFNLDAIISNYEKIIGPLPDVASFNGPVLFIKGSESDYILPGHQSAILQRFPAAKVKIINGTGHWLHAEKPAAFSKLVRDFLSFQP